MTSSYDPQYNVFRNDVTGAVTTMRMPVKEKRRDLSEVPLQKGTTTKYWVGKTLVDKQFCLIFADGSHKIFSDSNKPALSGKANLRCFSIYVSKYSKSNIDEDLEMLTDAYNKKSVVAFSKLAIEFRTKMETDKDFAADPKLQRIKDLMDLTVANNDKNLKAGSKGLPGICVIS